ncbi:hypothetical protein M407DRAFT_241663 [Tulasnella calospora MUT 4182]|uniref:Uncharacterized protein n=1 Tax=Tulasnella calospora MUT 4182 TaxID=1051891 RepID=A0A0C3LCR1_9AGAM|nr:hypothetical protein M407DRAFT_241663 [Tulasnella calospora MUT 4182]
MTPSTGRKRRTAFMRTFSGKMLTAPMKWKVNRRRRQQQEEEQEQEEDRTMSEVEEDRRRDTTASRASVAPPPLETQNSTSRLLALPLTSPTVEAPIPNSPPPPPPASLQPPNPTTTTPPHDQGEDDDDDPTSIQPPAYRRRNFGVRPRVRPTTTAPAAGPMSPRALEKQREAEGAGPAEDVPEEYMYLAGMMPPPVRSTTTTAVSNTPAGNDAALGLDRRSRGVAVRPPVEQDRDEEDEDEEDDGADGEEQGEARREDVTAHLATDDKSHLARLHQSSSAPSAPPALDSEDEDGQDLRAVVPQEEEIYELEGSGSSSHLPPPPPPPLTLLPAPPAITSAHLFFPPPPPHEASDLPRYVAGPSAPSLLGPEKLSIVSSAPEDATLGPSEPPVLPSAPPAENDQAAIGLAVVPSAPPMLEDGEVQQALGLVPSAPPVEDHGDASAPSRAA